MQYTENSLDNLVDLVLGAIPKTGAEGTSRAAAGKQLGHSAASSAQRMLSVAQVCEQFLLEFGAVPHTSFTLNDMNVQLADINRVPTYLIGGASEPIYLPYTENVHDHFSRHVSTGKLRWLGNTELNKLPFGNKIFFTRDYISSALHEAAHWCIAGAQRRTKVDYDYWYAPDGRNLTQQAQFERAELKPQALEKAFSEACALPFKVSNDNLDLVDYDDSHFAKAVNEQYDLFMQGTMPPRASRFVKRLAKVLERPQPQEEVLNVV